MRLSDYRLKFAELIGPWTTDPSNKKNEILAIRTHMGTLGANGLSFWAFLLNL